ncbi:MAG: DUF4124 domain-containing protein [Burkholderiales bacterium RIFCSPHIGHO2_12_FULL_61_11]|nr:MAG: DUF4124 domain-containing protein [Burkholderiales bacterium RIFCSPHIGHO2_12_FULL_61_11]
MLSQTTLTVGLLWVACLGGNAAAQGIYTCVDAKGRTLTADRPIIECLDRSQQELTRSGTVKRQIGPSLTAHEQAAQQEKDRRAAELRAREAEEKRRDRALLLRYPSRAVHDQERATALSQIDEVIKASSKRTLELVEHRKAVNSEFEFYVKDPSKAPSALKRRLEENDSSMLVQKKFILDQELEKKRVNRRFDEELVKLKELWASSGDAPANAVANRPKTTVKN